MSYSGDEIRHTMKKLNSKESKDDVVKEILKLVEQIQFGSITIIVQGGKIMQVEKNEKIRLK